jgi:hypothetical protein
MTMKCFFTTLVTALSLIAVPAHAQQKVGVGSFESSLSCDAALERLNSYGSLSSLDQLETSTVLARCAASKHNKENPTDPVVVQTQPAPNDGQSKILYNIIHVKDAEKVIAGCAGALTIGGMLVGDTEGQLAGAFGDLTCSAYYEAAAKNDPLLILAPSMIPGDKVTRDVLAKIGLGETYDKAKNEIAKAAEKITEEAKRNPGMVIAPTVVAPVQALCKLAKWKKCS